MMEGCEQIVGPLAREGAQRVAVWVVPRWHEVADLLAMAAITAQDTTIPTGDRLRYAGMVDAAGWVQDLSFGPVTGRDEVPVTLAAAQAETATADLVLHNRPEHLVRELCVSLGVRYLPPLPDLSRDFVRGAWITLRWLTGRLEIAPLPVPYRHPDGSMVTAAEIYDVMIAGEPDADAARRAEMRREAARAADESYSVATLIGMGPHWSGHRR